jgi:nucleotide-binding universal stress UspA family protein
MKRILLPTDFSNISINAIKYAVSLYKESKCEFFVLNVYRVPYATNEELMENDAQQLAIVEAEMFDASKKSLKELVTSLGKNENHVFHTISDYNFFINSVKQAAKDKDIELIVMGTKGATGAKEIFLGSNTGDVLMKTDCNVIAVPENSVYKAPKEIVFPTDFKLRYELKDLAPLIELAQTNQSTLRILHFSQDGQLSQEQEGNKQILNSYLEELEHTFHTLTNIDFEEALNCFVQSRGNIDMIAMISGHYNFFQRLFFRPKVMELSFHTQIPLYVLHHKE